MENQNKTGVELIADERHRQVSEKGCTPEHDDGHDKAELAIEAGRWALEGTSRELGNGGMCCSASGRRAKSRIRQLTIAGALIAAEIDRLQRRNEK